MTMPLTGLLFIHLLVRQNLQSIGQVVTQPQRCRMCFEDFRAVCVGAELYRPYPVGRSPIVFAGARCASPATLVLLSAVAVTMSR